MFFRRRLQLADSNVVEGWSGGTAWLQWECPRNLVAGESFHTQALEKLTGSPRRWGYLIPVHVTLVREPTNQYDRNAFRMEITGTEVGHLRRPVAAQIAPILDKTGCTTFTVCGVLRGGQLDAPNIGCHVWLNRRLTPGPDVTLADDAWSVPWPPYASEGTSCSTDEDAAAGKQQARRDRQ